MIAETSRESYHKLIPRLGVKQQVIYEVIKEYGPITNERIAYILGWEINKVTGRVNELASIGIIEHRGYDITRSKRRAKTWAIIPSQKTDSSKPMKSGEA